MRSAHAQSCLGCLLGLLCAVLTPPALARTPYDDMAEHYARQEHSAPKLSELKDPNAKNFSYYTYRRFKTLATAFVNWMNAPVLAQSGTALEASTVRMGAEFRGYVLARLEQTHPDWRKRCDSPTEMEAPNLLVYQIAMLVIAEEPPQEADWGDTELTTTALAQALFQRCMPSAWPESKGKP